MKKIKNLIYRLSFAIRITIVIALLMPSGIFGQSKLWSKNFTSADGLTQNAISGMMFDNSGYLWLATPYGVIRYDGFGFKTFLPDTAKSKTNPSNQVLGISCEGTTRKILIRTKNGLVHTVKDGKLILYDSSINNITFTYGLNGHFPDEGTYNKFNLPYEELVHKYEWDPNTRNILPVNSTDFIVLSNNSRILFYYKNGIKQRNIVLNNKFSFFLKAGKYGLLADNNNDFLLYDSITGNFNEITNPLKNITDKNDNAEKPLYYWDTYNDEAYCYINSTFYRIDVDEAGNSLKYITCFSIEKNGHLWTGIIYDPLNSIYYLSTLSNGLFQIKLKQIQTLKPFNGLSNDNNVEEEFVNYTILKTSDSNVLTPSGFQFTASANGDVSFKKTAVISNRETMGKLNNTSVICAEGSKIFYYSRSDNYSRKNVYNKWFNEHNDSHITLLQPEGDSVWVGTRRAISCITPRSETTVFYRNKDDKSVFFGLCLFYRISNEVAFISNGFGLYKLKTVAPFSIDTIPEMAGMQVRYISAYKNFLLLSVYKQGLFLYNNNRFYKIPLNNDQPELNFCHSTYIDKSGDVWIATDNGMFRTSLKGILESATDSVNYPFFFKYGEANGITNVEFNGGGTSSYAVLANGRLFYPSMGGVVTFDPATLNDSLLRTPIFIDKIESDDNILQPLSDSIHLNANFKYLNIKLSIPYFGEPENLVLEYNVDNTQWKRIAVLPFQNIEIFNLSSGNHKLVIRKRVGFGKADYIFKTINIFREKYFYDRVWFYPLVAVIAGLLIFLIVKMQTRTEKRKRIELQKLVEEQTLVLSKTVEAKELMINIISHDMVTPIRHISLVTGFIEKGLEKNPVKIKEALKDIEATSDKILTASLAITDYMEYNTSKVIVNKKEENLYILVQEVCEIFLQVAKDNNISIHNNVKKMGIAKIDRTIFSIILNNIISNAIKYSGKGEITIFKDTATETEKVLVIKDTGKGIAKDTLYIIQEILRGNLQIIKTTNKASTGLGYMLISQLAAVHDLKVVVDSEVDKGTTVKIIISR